MSGSWRKTFCDCVTIKSYIIQSLSEIPLTTCGSLFLFAYVSLLQKFGHQYDFTHNTLNIL
jgi:hypothetical protein